uniref:Flavoprotein domain-containing protein n=1 Tax=Rhabditophanes sp. KR3021 TaxID=114890 RepID=A0AC35UHT9_9BILA
MDGSKDSNDMKEVPNTDGKTEVGNCLYSGKELKDAATKLDLYFGPKTINDRTQCIEPSFRLLIGVTGSVAASKLRLLVGEVRKVKTQKQIEIFVVATETARFFFDDGNCQDPFVIFRDVDQWGWGKINDPILHIELKNWADCMLIAPLDANTMAKIAAGICDNLLTSIVTAWDSEKPVLFAPAMNTQMWNNRIVQRNLETIKEMYGWRQIGPISKMLACKELGMGGMCEVETICAVVAEIVDGAIIS